jgi:hypothetical protein
MASINGMIVLISLPAIFDNPREPFHPWQLHPAYLAPPGLRHRHRVPPRHGGLSVRRVREGSPVQPGSCHFPSDRSCSSSLPIRESREGLGDRGIPLAPGDGLLLPLRESPALLTPTRIPRRNGDFPSGSTTSRPRGRRSSIWSSEGCWRGCLPSFSRV